MSTPSNPLTVVVKNKYYPSGLKEGKIYDHYIKNKKQILKELDYRPVLLFIFTDVNKWVVKRKINGRPIILDEHNYDEIITGRTVSISVERGNKARYLCIDVDPGPSTNEFQVKQAVENVLQSSITALSKAHRVISTSSGYHIYLYLKKPLPIATASKVLSRALSMDFQDKYVLGGKAPKGNDIKLDTSTTRNKGSHTVAYGLSRNGLIAMDVTNQFKNFTKKKAILK